MRGAAAGARPFVCRGFVVHHDRCGLKVGADTIYFAAYVARQQLVGGRPELPRTALDVGSGTGLLSLILAHRLPSLESVHGVEIDADAYEQTKINYDLSPWRRKTRAHHTSFQDYAQAFAAERMPDDGHDDDESSAEDSSSSATSLARVHGGYDLIICNPPYHPRPPQHPSSDHSPRAHARFSDYLSSAELLSGVAQCLHKERGQFWLFYPYLQADQFTSDAARNDLRLRHRCDICFRRGKHLQRSILMFERTSPASGATSLTAAAEHVQVTLREEDSAYTREFVEATRDIYNEPLSSTDHTAHTPRTP